MWRVFAVALLGLWLCPFAFAQNTLVSGTITDSAGVVWRNGSFQFVFVPSPSNPTAPLRQNGVSFVANPVPLQPGNLDNTGSFTSVAVPDNLQITPSGSTWNLQVCPAATASNGCFIVKYTITGATQNITSSFTPPAIVVNMANPPPGASAYFDAEVFGAKVGNFYFNLTDGLIHVCSGFPPCIWLPVGNVSGSVSTSGSPVAGNVAVFSSPTVITNSGGNIPFLASTTTLGLTGFIRLGNSDRACWHDSFTSADVCIFLGGANGNRPVDTLYVGGQSAGGNGLSTSAIYSSPNSPNTMATSGFINMLNTDLICWRNAGNTADLCLNSSIVGGTGSVTSVGLAAPPELNVTNTPVTSAGTLTEAWQSQVLNMVFASGATGTFGGVMDGNASPTGNSTSASSTLTPSTTHDWAFSVVQTTGQAAHPTMPGGWVLQNTNGNNGDVFTQEFNSGAAITATQTLGASATWANQTFLLTLNAAPSIVQNCGTSGGFSGSGGVTCTLNTSNTVTGNSIIVVVYGVPPSSGTVSGNFSDSSGDVFSPLNYSQNGANEYVITALASNIVGGVKPVITFIPTSPAGSFTSSEFFAAEVSGVNLTNGKPGFRRLQLADMPAQLQAPPVSVFTNQNLSGDVAVSAATLTTVDTLTMTMPATGCPCRVLLSYAYGWTYTTSGAVDFYIDDGLTHQIVKAASKSTSGGTTVGGVSASAFSPVTYANSAVVSFAVTTKGEQTYTVKVAASQAGPSSYVQGAIFTSK